MYTFLITYPNELCIWNAISFGRLQFNFKKLKKVFGLCLHLWEYYRLFMVSWWRDSLYNLHIYMMFSMCRTFGINLFSTNRANVLILIILNSIVVIICPCKPFGAVKRVVVHWKTVTRNFGAPAAAAASAGGMKVETNNLSTVDSVLG